MTAAEWQRVLHLDEFVKTTSYVSPYYNYNYSNSTTGNTCYNTISSTPITYRTYYQDVDATKLQMERDDAVLRLKKLEKSLANEDFISRKEAIETFKFWNTLFGLSEEEESILNKVIKELSKMPPVIKQKGGG